MEILAFPWVEDLPESEQLSFWNGLRIALHNTHASLSKPTAHDYEAESTPVIAMWRGRAQMYASMSLEERQNEVARRRAYELFFEGHMPHESGPNTVEEVEEKILAILTAVRRVG